MHGLALDGELGLDLLVPRHVVRLDSTLGQRPVQADAGIVKPQLHHGEVGSRGFEKLRQLELPYGQLRAIQILHRIPEVQQQEVAFVADNGVHSGGRVLIAFHALEKRRGGGASGGPAPGGECVPGGPAETEHLMQHARALQGQRRGGQVLDAGRRAAFGGGEIGWHRGVRSWFFQCIERGSAVPPQQPHRRPGGAA